MSELAQLLGEEWRAVTDALGLMHVSGLYFALPQAWERPLPGTGVLSTRWEIRKRLPEGGPWYNPRTGFATLEELKEWVRQDKGGVYKVGDGPT